MDALQKQNVDGIGSLVEKANTGDTNAMYQLAWCHHHTRRGVAKNLDQAQHWYHMAHDGQGLFLIGREYYYGTDGGGCGRGASGVVVDENGVLGCPTIPHRDVDKAVSAWTMAADLGDGGAIARLGWCHQHGQHRS
ncbi:hypothetical protein Pelo_19728 [Pelomyxa schiedti]|nr:hypothetical protein Pelo_19728 [Pelomyxa schiedti]